MMQLICFTSCNSAAAALVLLLIAAFSTPASSSYDNQPLPPPHQLQYTRPLPYHRLVEQEPKPSSATGEVPHAIESRANSVPLEYHAPEQRVPYHSPKQTQLYLLPPQPLPSSLYPRRPHDHGEYRSPYKHPNRQEEGEEEGEEVHHPSQESHPLESQPPFASGSIRRPHESAHESSGQHPHLNYHLRPKHDHEEPSSLHYSASDHLHHAPSHEKDVPAHTHLYHSQDTHGNYGFGYKTETIKGDGNYRYEKKEGSETSGGYGFKTDGGKVESHFHTHPHPHHHHLHDHASAEHEPPFVGHPHHVTHHPEHLSLPHYHAGLTPLTGNHLYESAAERSPVVYNGPQYDSMYDVNTPHVLYAHIADELGNEETANSVASRAAASASDSTGDDDEERRSRDDERLAYASSSPAEPIMTETMNALKSSPFLSQYLSTLESLTPSGFASRMVQVYKDRKKKKK